MTAAQLLSESGTSTSSSSSSSSSTSSIPSPSRSLSGVSQFSSTLLDLHQPVDSRELARVLPLLQKSSIQVRKEQQQAPKQNRVGLSLELQEQIAATFENQMEIPDVEFGVARIMSNSNTEATLKASILVGKILGNVLAHPNEEKYLTLRLTTSAAQRRLLPISGTMDILCAAGFDLLNVGGPDPSLTFRADREGNAERLQMAAERIAMMVSQLEATCRIKS